MSVKLWNSTWLSSAGSNVGNGVFVDASGNIHCVGWDVYSGASTLYYAVSTDGGATFTNGDGGGSGTYHSFGTTVYFPLCIPAVVVDSANKIYIFYQDHNGQSYFVKKSSGAWGAQTSTGAVGNSFYQSIYAEVDSSDNLILFGGGNNGSGSYYKTYVSSVNGGTTWVDNGTAFSANYINKTGDMCLDNNKNIWTIWNNSSFTCRVQELLNNGGSPNTWTIQGFSFADAGSNNTQTAIICNRDSQTIWAFRCYTTGGTHALQYKLFSSGSWGSWTNIITNVSNDYIDLQAVRLYNNNIYLVYEIVGTSTLYYVLWNGSSWSAQATFLASAVDCYIQQPNIPNGVGNIAFSYKPSGANEQWFSLFEVPSVLTYTNTDTITLSDIISQQVNTIKTDVLSLSDAIQFAPVEEQGDDTLILSDSINVHITPIKETDTDALSLSDVINVWTRPQREILSDTLSLSDAIHFDMPYHLLETLVLSDNINVQQPLAFLHNKISFILQTIKNINNKFTMLKSSTIKFLNKITSRSQGLYSCKNDFRMREPWQVPVSGQAQSLGKEFVKVYINGIEPLNLIGIPSVDVDSISITKGLNAPHIASLLLALPYDNIIPDIQSTIEIRYGQNVDRTKNWLLYGGYIVEITPTDNPECIQLRCEDEMWNQNKTRLYFRVGHLPFGATPGEVYYPTPKTALSALGIDVGFGDFIPQTIDCWGKAKSETITDLIVSSGNYAWFYNEDGTPMIWSAGAGGVVNLEAQEVNKNLNLYNVLNHNIKYDSSRVINQLRVQMGNFVNELGNRTYAGYKYTDFYFQPNPTWNTSLERLATPTNGLGYDFFWHNPAQNDLFKDVFKKWSLDIYESLDSQFSKWTDRYAPRVEISNPHIGFGWTMTKPEGVLKDGYTIDYKNSLLIFSEPIYCKQTNDKGELTAICRPNVFVTLFKKQYYVPSASPLYFFTPKIGDFYETRLGDLILSGLSIQQGGSYIDDNGVRQYIPSWDDTGFALDDALWQLSKTCDEKILASINLTLDAVCFYGINLANRIQVPGLIDAPLNILSMSYRLSDFQVTLNLENNRSYTRSVSIESRGEDYF
jgi:hypothetical protein